MTAMQKNYLIELEKLETQMYRIQTPPAVNRLTVLII